MPNTLSRSATVSSSAQIGRVPFIYGSPEEICESGSTDINAEKLKPAYRAIRSCLASVHRGNGSQSIGLGSIRVREISEFSGAVLLQAYESVEAKQFSYVLALLNSWPVSVSAASAEFAAYEIAIPGPLEVDQYLSDHANLKLLLPQICQRVRAEFGKAAELSLELYRDPEIDDQYLTLYVRQSRYDANITEKLDRLNEQFSVALQNCTGYFLLTTDFRLPRSKDAV